MSRSLASSAVVVVALMVWAGAPASHAARMAGPARPAADRPVIQSVTVRPGAPVAGPKGGVKLVVDVVARGATGRDGVTLRVEPGVRRAGAAAQSGPVAAPVGRGAAGETWRFHPPAALTRWYPSGRWRAIATARNAEGARVTATSYFLFRKATRFSGFRVTRAGKGPAVRLAGTLTRVDPSGRFDFWSFPGQRVTLQFSRRGGEWRNVAEVRTNTEGYFAEQVKRVKRARGTWRALYAGTSHYAPATTSARYVTRN